MSELSPEHRDYLINHAVDPELATSLGVRSLTGRPDVATLGEPWRDWANFPAIAFPWTGPDGRIEWQIRPDNPTEDRSGRARKYVFRPGMVPVLWAVRPVEGAEKALIVEGTKQCLAAATYAPPEVAVYGIAGCRMWQSNGIPIPDLLVAEDREMVVILDSDAACNAEVYAAGEGLAHALEERGATRVTFGRMTASGKAGLDDVLATLPEGKRAGYLARLIERARPKPADAKPKPSKKTAPEPPPDPGDGRVVVLVDQDRRDVIRSLTDAMVAKFSGTRLFNHGGVVSELKGVKMTPVSRGTFNALVQDAAVTGTQTPKGFVHGWPDANVMLAVLSKADEFAPLDQVSTVPYVRQDGTVVTTPGYDPASRTVLVLGGLDGIEVPEHPNPADIRTARELILTEWLGDFAFPTEADRANALALVLTPFIRGLVDIVPLAVIDGKQMGVGKGLLADCVAILVTGQSAHPHPYNRDDQEHRKVITAAFRAGGELVIFDEAHVLEGGNFARAITSSTYTDRLLGESAMADFPNRVTWLSLGNQVKVNGDMIRRVYRIGIYPDGDNPQDRPTSVFRHPGQSGMDLRSWTRAHRAELVRAALVLVRAWFDAGRPVPDKATAFGSFEQWEATVGGIIAHAGVSGFLGNLAAWREDADEGAAQWAVHLGWLRERFGSEAFTAAQVRAEALKHPDSYDGACPPGEKLADPTSKTFTVALGQRYNRINGRAFGGLRVVKVAGKIHNNLVGYRVCEVSPTSPESSGGLGGLGGLVSPPTRVENLTPVRLRDDTTTRTSQDTRFHAKNGADPTPPTPPTPPTNGHKPRPGGSDPSDPPACDQCGRPVPETVEMNGRSFPRATWLRHAGPRCSPGCVRAAIRAGALK